MSIGECLSSPAAEKSPELEFETLALCPICGSSGYGVAFERVRDALFGLSGEFRYVQCYGCTAVYQNPRPTATSLPKCYKSYHTHSSIDVPTSFAGPWRGARSWIRGGVLARKFGYYHLAPSRLATMAACLLDVVPTVRSRTRCGLGVGKASGLPRFTGNGRALDIGTGNGVYGAILSRLGWDVVGVDFDPIAAENAAQKYGFPVYTGTLESADFQSKYFDYVSMFDVIEHLPDPVSTLRECHRIIRPGGTIVIRTPNYDSVTRRVYGRHWRGLEAPRHLHLFNSHTVKLLFDAAGFRITKLATPLSALSFYIQSSLQIRAAEGEPAQSALSTLLRRRLYEAIILGGRCVGKMLGDVLHVEGIR